jgi:hypothetical protein
MANSCFYCSSAYKTLIKYNQWNINNCLLGGGRVSIGGGTDTLEKSIRPNRLVRIYLVVMRDYWKSILGQIDLWDMSSRYEKLLRKYTRPDRLVGIYLVVMRDYWKSILGQIDLLGSTYMVLTRDNGMFARPDRLLGSV